MKACEHYAESLRYTAAAADNEIWEAAILQATLAIAEALQAMVMQHAIDEIQYPRERAQWRDLWQGHVPPRKCT